MAARIAARDAKLTKKQRRAREERRRLVQKTRPMLTLGRSVYRVLNLPSHTLSTRHSRLRRRPQAEKRKDDDQCCYDIATY